MELLLLLALIIFLIVKKELKILYYILGVIVCIIVTVLGAYVLTLGVSNFEGGRSYTLFLLIPILFMLILFIWKTLHKKHKNKPKFYIIASQILGGLVLLSSLLFYGYHYIYN